MNFQFENNFSSKGVDETNGIVSGVSIITSGIKARGHDLEVDDMTVAQMFSCAKSKGKVPVKWNHKTGSDAINGYLTNFTVEGNQLKGDWVLLKSHSQYDHALEMASEMPESFGLSASFQGEAESVGGQKKARCSELVSVDVVATPAANPNGLFEAGPEDDSEVIQFASKRTFKRYKKFRENYSPKEAKQLLNQQNQRRKKLAIGTGVSAVAAAGLGVGTYQSASHINRKRAKDGTIGKKFPYYGDYKGAPGSKDAVFQPLTKSGRNKRAKERATYKTKDFAADYFSQRAMINFADNYFNTIDFMKRPRIGVKGRMKRYGRRLKDGGAEHAQKQADRFGKHRDRYDEASMKARDAGDMEAHKHAEKRAVQAASSRAQANDTIRDAKHEKWLTRAELLAGASAVGAGGVVAGREINKRRKKNLSANMVDTYFEGMDQYDGSPEDGYGEEPQDVGQLMDVIADLADRVEQQDAEIAEIQGDYEDGYEDQYDGYDDDGYDDGGYDPGYYDGGDYADSYEGADSYGGGEYAGADAGGDGGGGEFSAIAQRLHMLEAREMDRELAAEHAEQEHGFSVIREKVAGLVEFAADLKAENEALREHMLTAGATGMDFSAGDLPTTDFDAVVDQYEEQGLHRGEATRAAISNHPDLYFEHRQARRNNLG